jgi:hypothetical protein
LWPQYRISVKGIAPDLQMLVFVLLFYTEVLKDRRRVASVLKACGKSYLDPAKLPFKECLLPFCSQYFSSCLISGNVKIKVMTVVFCWCHTISLSKGRQWFEGVLRSAE